MTTWTQVSDPTSSWGDVIRARYVDDGYALDGYFSNDDDTITTPWNPTTDGTTVWS